LFGRGWYKLALFSWYKLCSKYCARIVKKLVRGPNLDLVSGCDLDQVHVGIRKNHTCKKDLVSGRDLVNFGPNLFGYQMAPIFVILFADLSFLPTSHTTQAQFCLVSTPIQVAMLPLLSSNRRRQPEKRRRV
jgi:hypothetical protein